MPCLLYKCAHPCLLFAYFYFLQNNAKPVLVVYRVDVGCMTGVVVGPLRKSVWLLNDDVADSLIDAPCPGDVSAMLPGAATDASYMTPYFVMDKRSRCIGGAVHFCLFTVSTLFLDARSLQDLMFTDVGCEAVALGWRMCLLAWCRYNIHREMLADTVAPVRVSAAPPSACALGTCRVHVVLPMPCSNTIPLGSEFTYFLYVYVCIWPHLLLYCGLITYQIYTSYSHLYLKIGHHIHFCVREEFGFPVSPMCIERSIRNETHNPRAVPHERLSEASDVSRYDRDDASNSIFVISYVMKCSFYLSHASNRELECKNGFRWCVENGVSFYEFFRYSFDLVNSLSIEGYFEVAVYTLDLMNICTVYSRVFEYVLDQMYFLLLYKIVDCIRSLSMFGTSMIYPLMYYVRNKILCSLLGYFGVYVWVCPYIFLVLGPSYRICYFILDCASDPCLCCFSSCSGPEGVLETLNHPRQYNIVRHTQQTLQKQMGSPTTQNRVPSSYFRNESRHHTDMFSVCISTCTHQSIVSRNVGLLCLDSIFLQVKVCIMLSWRSMERRIAFWKKFRHLKLQRLNFFKCINYFRINVKNVSVLFVFVCLTVPYHTQHERVSITVYL